MAERHRIVQAIDCYSEKLWGKALIAFCKRSKALSKKPVSARSDLLQVRVASDYLVYMSISSCQYSRFGDLVTFAAEKEYETFAQCPTPSCAVFGEAGLFDDRWYDPYRVGVARRVLPGALPPAGDFEPFGLSTIRAA